VFANVVVFRLLLLLLFSQVCKNIPSHALGNDGKIEGDINMQLPCVIRLGTDYVNSKCPEAADVQVHFLSDTARFSEVPAPVLQMRAH
jgi:hypothetical protein